VRAAFYRRQGPASEVLEIGEQPTPVPGSGEVRVRVRASGVNPSDWKVRRGGFGRGLAAPLVIPHSDGAGEIDRVGPGVSDRVGARVWLWNGQWKRPFGTAAEYIVLPSEQAVPLPDHLSFSQGACLGIPALTAMHAVRTAGIGAQSTALVSGGAGSVANYAIQFAKHLGATVLTTVSSDAKAVHASLAGADHVVNYRTEDVGERIKTLTGGAGVDSVLEVDLSGNAKTYPAILRPHATVVVYGMNANETTFASLWLMQNSISLRLFLVYDVTPTERAADIAALLERLQDARTIHTIARELPLERIAEAHDLVESRSALGNVILTID